jgi:hypothetical protein
VTVVSQIAPETQSVSRLHVVPHTAPLHKKNPQLEVTAPGQLPAPSHVAANVSESVALLQLAARHAVDDGGYAHAVADDPSHVPPHGAAPPPVHAVRDPCGCPLVTV